MKTSCVWRVIAKQAATNTGPRYRLKFSVPGKKTVVGWRERVDLPEWGVEGILAKVDTGARTSALHVENVRHISEDRVAFEVVRSRKKDAEHKTVEARVVRETRVRNTSGHFQERIVVATTMRLGEKEKRIEMTLVSRSHMICRMLIGRTALEGDFLVDVDLRHTSDKP